MNTVCSHERLTFGCSGCIHRREVDQFRAEIVRMDLADLVIALTEGEEHICPVGWKLTELRREIARRPGVQSL